MAQEGILVHLEQEAQKVIQEKTFQDQMEQGVNQVTIASICLTFFFIRIRVNGTVSRLLL